MSWVKLDYGAEVRQLELYMPRGPRSEWYEVDCPFCGMNQLVQTRKFHQGVRCHNPGCRAMLRGGSWDGTRDMMPEELTVIRHGLRTRVDLDEPNVGANASLAEVFAADAKGC